MADTTTTKVFEWCGVRIILLRISPNFVFTIIYSNTYCYLSLPVFSHWQGRLDPRVMILGRARTVARSTTEGGRGRGRRDVVLRPRGVANILSQKAVNIRRRANRIAKSGTGENMKVNKLSVKICLSIFSGYV